MIIIMATINFCRPFPACHCGTTKFNRHGSLFNAAWVTLPTLYNGLVLLVSATDTVANKFLQAFPVHISNSATVEQLDGVHVQHGWSSSQSQQTMLPLYGVLSW